MTRKLLSEFLRDSFPLWEDASLAMRDLHVRSRQNAPGPISMVQLRRFGPNRSMTRCMTGEESVAQTREAINEALGDNLWFVAASARMRKVCAQAEVLAKVDVPVLLIGESGSGKEIVARLIHKRSSRQAHKFHKVNCAALDPEILERDLFDKETGMWSSAGKLSSGFEACNDGTLLLEDIDEMPARTQAKLVCHLQDSQLSPGRENMMQAGVRVLASTKANIRTALRQQKLRKELYYCLSAFTISIPPLRHRKDEVPLLLRHFANRVAADYGLPVRHFSAEVLLACQNYSWPGNLRELEKFAKRYVISGEDESLWCQTPVPEVAGSAEHIESVQNTLASKSLLHNVREAAERNAISTALEQTRWNRTAAARLLNVSYRTLLYKIQQYNMSPGKH
jgi:DNA-binding NtrC family response regulator